MENKIITTSLAMLTMSLSFIFFILQTIKSFFTLNEDLERKSFASNILTYAFYLICRHKKVTFFSCGKMIIISNSSKVDCDNNCNNNHYIKLQI